MTPSQIQPLPPEGGPSQGVPEVWSEGGPQGAFSAPPPLPEQGIQWGRYIAALRRYKWLMLAVIVVGTAGSVGASRFLHPEYTATATIYIEPPPDDAGPIRAGELLRSYGWVELLGTGAVLDSVALSQRLYLNPVRVGDSIVFRDFRITDSVRVGSYTLTVNESGKQWVLSSLRAGQVETGAAGDSIGRSVGFGWAPAAAALTSGAEIQFNVVSPREAGLALAKQLKPVINQQQASFLRLSLTGSDPRKIAAILNDVSTQFVSVAADLKRRKLNIQTDNLAQQVAYANEQLRETESRLESFRVNTITLPGENVPVAAGLQSTQPTVLTNYFNQKIQVEELKRDRTALQRVVARMGTPGFSMDAFQTIPAVQNAPDLKRALEELSTADAELRALRFRYTDEHKPVRDLQDRVTALQTQVIPGYANALIQQMQGQELALTGQIATQSKDLQQIPIRTITEQRLTREQAAAANLYTILSNRYEEAKLALASAIPDVKVLDAAVPPRFPSQNSAPRIILLGMMASIGLAAGLAILLDHLDKRFRYPDQVTRELGLTILGAVPALKRGKDGSQKPADASQTLEAFRSIRLNLAHSYGSGPVRLTITSPGPSEGKSLISSNLAMSFAEAGYKTLLIDGDIRRGELHRKFAVNRQPGLLDYLGGDATVPEILRPTSHGGLTLIPCGTRLHHGPEMLGSSKMSELMAQLKSTFNVILVDSPPLGAGIDPFVLGAATGHMVLVLRSGETDRAMAEEKLKLVDRLPIRLLGAVLNDVDTRQSSYKYYTYVYGYAAEDDPAQLGAGA
jgi:capsular exopolysaccharide synthesis family protein